MTIWPVLFEAFLKCPTKCWLRSVGEAASGNRYDDWVQAQNKAYRAAGRGLLLSHRPQDECVISPSEEDLKGARWGLAIDLPVRTPEFPQPRNSRLESALTSHAPIPTPHSAIEMSLVPSSATDQASAAPAVFTAEIRLHAVERVPSEGRGRPAQFIPLRFVFTNKLTKDDKLLLAIDAFALSEAMGRKIAVGKIIHGPDHATLRVKTLALAGEVRKRLEKIAVLLSSPAPPDLVLNRHCNECEFQARCRQKALEKDDLSLLAGMTEKERKRLHNKGIFTVTQLSYTFRPRRRPKRLRDKREKYHHSLKALAIREKKIHIVGSPELKIEGTPIYLDVEGLPDRDFYYLIGMRIGNGESAVQHSLWADSVEDEGKIWKEFLGILETVEKPVLIHYGSYEAEFLRRMQDRHGDPANGCEASKAIQSPLNLLSFMFGQIYFPTYSNTIKEIGNYLGFRWSEAGASGQLSILWRLDWEVSKRHNVRDKLIAYNSEDCEALHELAESCQEICRKDVVPPTLDPQSTVQVDSLKQSGSYKWGRNTFSIPEFDFINEAAYWSYQRDRIYVKTDPRLRRSLESRKPQKCLWTEMLNVISAPTCAQIVATLSYARLNSGKRSCTIFTSADAAFDVA
jgi:predicted RecB family nuclease